jgi:type I restriction enzyme, S subunit
LPPIEEQRRIVSQLGTVAAHIEARTHTAAEIEKEISAALKWGFKKITAGVVRSPMRKVAPLVRRPVEIDPDGAYPELGVRSFGKGTFHKAVLAGLDVGTKKLFRIQSSDLIFNIVFAWEGAVAIAKLEDDGRFGSHRFLTCVPDPGKATSEFLRYFFLSEEGLQLLGEASPGGAGRNRTLGLDALELIEVPIPSLNDQIWFDELQKKAAVARARSVEAANELTWLIPSILHEVF